MSIKYITIVSIIMLLGCTNQNIDEKQRETVQEEMKNRELKKVSDVDILDKGKQIASMIADTAQKTLAGELMRTIQNEGMVAAIDYCNVVAYPLMDSLSRVYNASIKRASLRARNPKDAPNPFEAQMLEAYQYAVEQNQPAEADIQLSDDREYVLYSKPITIQKGICLSCHGTAGEQITPDVVAKIDELYPNDNAKGHAMGDLRGIWSIKIPTDEVVKKL